MKKFFFIFVAILLCSSSAFSMHKAAKGFATLCKVAKWGVVALPAINDIHTIHIHEKELPKRFLAVTLLEKPNDKMLEHVHHELMAMGLDPKTVIVRIRDGGSEASAMQSPRTIFLRKDVACWLSHDSDESQINSADSYINDINKARFAIQHEAAHLLHNDGVPLDIMKNRAITLFTSVGLALITNKVFSFINPARKILQRSALRYIGHSFSQIPRTFMIVLTQEIGDKYLSRQREQRADDAVQNDIAVLQSGISIFAAKTKHVEPDSESEEEENSLSNRLDRLASTHPTAAQRIAKLQARIDALKAKEAAGQA